MARQIIHFRKILPDGTVMSIDVDSMLKYDIITEDNNQDVYLDMDEEEIGILIKALEDLKGTKR